MDLPLSSALTPALHWLDRAGSTNELLVREASGPSAADWPDLSVVVTDDQVAGKGRLGRVWTAPAGRCLAISVLLRPAGASGAPVPLERFGMLPLVVGVAMARAVRSLLPASAEPLVGIKWPNDVLIDDRKVCGILAELLPGGGGVVVGTGLNLSLTEEELPTPTATSLALAGAPDVAPDVVLSAYLRSLGEVYRQWLAHDGDPVASGLLDAATAASATLGRPVRVELPGEVFRTGVARSLDATGRLVVDLDDSPDPLVVSAGDVTHLRHRDSR
ncbi:biotin--[acetyl-CoA-carboxylase] ligase [Herbiconiux sp. YIM B11900]|uniref:biotin--[acetyl-CoA-carboxylase] ligase n=1 Tax=Herbiconiux sp. YIM B11900 TaxID=3404131 RepID=UPI003F8617FC